MKCEICNKRIWFWQYVIEREILAPLYVPVFHRKCYLKPTAQLLAAEKFRKEAYDKKKA